MKKFLMILALMFSMSAWAMPVEVDSALVRDANDSIRVSLVTCSPGTEVYAVYGHTALRIEIPAVGVDMAVNYGLFAFDAPNFIWKFIKGDTDYVVGALNYPIFEREYTERGSSVTLQQLNLSEAEKVKLIALLNENLRPENRTYRYNFLYNNCSTKARDKVEEALSARLKEVKADTCKGATYREILHQYTIDYPWLQFGIDYLLGVEADRPIDARQQMFAPEYLQDYVAEMQLAESAKVFPYVVAERVIEPIEPQEQVWGFPLTPTEVMILFLLVVAVMCTLEVLFERRLWWFDTLLFTIQGLMGCIVAFLFFFSSHPTVGSNIHVIYLNPLPLLFIPFFVGSTLRRRVPTLSYVMVALYAGFIVTALLMDQYIQPAAWIFVSALLLRVLHNLWAYPYLKHRLKLRLAANNRSHGVHIRSVALAIALTAPALLMANTVESPKVVVSIVVDQLRADYMEKYMHLYGEDGFKKLLAEGRVYSNGYYSHAAPDRSSAVASIYSGTTPYYHGVVGNRFLERKSLRVLSSVDDERHAGVNTFESTSPSRLLVTTLTDELKLASAGDAYVVSIAPERDMAVLAGGHSPNTAIWLSDDHAQWATSAYYDGLPAWARSFNRRKGSRFDWKDMEWEPYYPIKMYDNSAYNGTPRAFTHTFRSDGSVKRYKTSACINDEITQLALACIEGSLMGRNNVTDMLCVGYYAGNFEHASAWERPVEQQDIYCRLDRNIAELLQVIDKEIGLDNALVVLTSTGYTDTNMPDRRQFSLPTGELRIEQCKALLNMYLGALYGPDNYVEGAYLNEIYLNRDLIEKRQLRMKEVLDCSAEFLCQKEGVKRVYAAIDLLTRDTDDNVSNSYVSACSGDLIIEVAPGWTLIDERWGEQVYYNRSNVPVPIIYYGAGLEPEFNRAPIAVECIAPTVSHVLRVNAPNACSERPSF
ncbi:MAG: alkaline phosphatase family protein [Bacteroidaceae bacterium]|nr:alkaline phosphatase family protein [Bacteroidaceae bacterium]